MTDMPNKNSIEHVLSSFKVNESVSLSSYEKENVLKSIFARAEYKAVRSPFYKTYKNYFVQYLRYSLPILLLVVVGTQAAAIFTNKTKVALSDLNEVRSSFDDLKRVNEIKSNLSKNRQDIQEIKTLALVDGKSAKTQILADKVSDRSKQIRNQVASLISENKITEAKKVALDLESALKADELYKVSTSVQQEVFEAIDLRVDIEKKEYTNISSSTESDIQARIVAANKDLATFNKTATTSEMLEQAQKSVEIASKYLQDKDLGDSIISLQLHDRIVAELKVNLLP